MEGPCPDCQHYYACREQDQNTNHFYQWIDALPITKNGGQSLAVGDIAANAHIILANIGASMEMLNAGSFPIASQFGADAGAHNNPVTADFHASEATQQTGVANVLDYRDKIVDGDWSVAIDDALSKAQKVIIPNMGFT